jgi:hypothetical protein
MVPGLRVESVTVAHGCYELRVHRVVGAPAGTRVTQTGWAVGPEEDLVSALHGLHGWDGAAEPARAPQGTAYTRWALVPRLVGRAGGTSVHACVATLTGAEVPAEPADAVGSVTVDGDEVEVVWSEGGMRTRIGFDPVRVSHGPA